jgi:hypothetical protein
MLDIVEKLDFAVFVGMRRAISVRCSCLRGIATANL